MYWPAHSLVGTIAASGLLALVLGLSCLYIYRRDRKVYLGFWALSVLVFSARHLLVGVAVAHPRAATLALFGDALANICGTLLFCWASYSFLRRSPPRAWLYISLLYLAAAVVLYVVYPSPVAVLVPAVFAAGMALRTAFLYLRAPDLDVATRRAPAIGLIGFAAQILVGPFWGHSVRAAAGGLFLSALLYTCVGLGILVAYYEKVKEALKESESRFRGLFEASLEGVLIVTEEGTVIEANPASAWTFGLPSQELVGRRVWELVDVPADCWPHCIPWDALLRLETTSARGDEGTFEAEVVARRQLYRGRPVVVVAVRDVTERKRAEESVRQSERRLRDMLESVHLISAMLDGRGRITFCNDFLLQLSGWNREAVIGQDWFEVFVPPENREKLRRRFASNLTSGRANSHDTNELLLRDGSRRMISWNITVLNDDEGRPIGTASIGEDITERMRAQATLAAERERLAVTLRSIADGVIATDAQGRVTLLSKVAEDLTGWTEKEARGQPITKVFDILDPEDRQPMPHPVSRVLAEGKRTDFSNHTTLLTRTGTELLVEHSAAPIQDAEGATVGAVLVFRDVTEKHRLERELQRASKLEAIGLLAGGIAHDFNNLLTAIGGNLALAGMSLEADEEAKESLAEAEKATYRARDLTQQLLTFAKGGAPIKETASLVELLRESTGFALRGSPVRCHFDIPEDLWPVEIDRGQISQVVNNLVINAVEAMPGGGFIKVSAENVHLDGEDLPLAPGDYVKVVVQDHGVGIAPDRLDQVFDPYFSTKESGSGLGLATSYSIVRRHNGHIAVESEVGRGSTFQVFLPALPYAERAQKPAPPPPPDQRPKGRVLVMDDEESVRRVVKKTLERLGYEAEVVPEGEAAIRAYLEARGRGKGFDAVIMDLTVPGGMGGKEAARALHSADPQVRIIASSGYSNDPVMSESAAYGFSGVIAKPYRVGDLDGVLRRVLGSAPAHAA
ncbi:MAG: PAS domain S-box protein [Anaerolineae bacterium]|nr:PAS domain S-box protein [Anaerolineae bacterium]